MKPTKILVVDDEPVIRATLQKLLSKRGYEVITAQNGEEAYELLHRDGAPGLAILDWMMPGIDGVELCRRLRASAKTRSTYVIMLTGRRERQDLVEGLNGGADDYMKKPCDIEELDARLQSAQRRLAQQEEVCSKASTDSLTGVFNRTAIVDLLRREIGYASLDGRPVSVLLVDVDHFKSVNENSGELMGDSALRHLARSIGASLRPFDSIGRYGGDEFMVVLPACGFPDALEVAERVRCNVAAQPLSTSVGAIALTVSIGIANSTGSCDMQDFISDADNALNRAKQAGRNRIECAPDRTGMSASGHSGLSRAENSWPPI
jgi:diguanylate cyclase (GGDEF)-like protein